MKYILSSVLVLVSLSAFAASSQWQLVCSNMAGDDGYAVTFSPDGLSAEVEMNNIAGAKVVARLACPKEKPAPCCDRITTTVCVDEASRLGYDTFYTATLQTGGIAGISKLTLNYGPSAVAIMNCRSEKVQ